MQIFPLETVQILPLEQVSRNPMVGNMHFRVQSGAHGGAPCYCVTHPGQDEV